MNDKIVLVNRIVRAGGLVALIVGLCAIMGWPGGVIALGCFLLVESIAP